MQMASIATTAAAEPAEALRSTLEQTAALRWRAVLEYRDAMRARGESVLFAPGTGEIDRLIHASGVRIGAQFVVLTRPGIDGKQQWDGIAGELVEARVGESILHGRGESDVDLWDVAGRYRRIALAAHPEAPAELAHVLHELEGSIGRADGDRP